MQNRLQIRILQDGGAVGDWQIQAAIVPVRANRGRPPRPASPKPLMVTFRLFERMIGVLRLQLSNSTTCRPQRPLMTKLLATYASIAGGLWKASVGPGS